MGTSAAVVGILSRYLARKRAKPILNPRIQRAINKRISRMRSPNGGKLFFINNNIKYTLLGVAYSLPLQILMFIMLVKLVYSHKVKSKAMSSKYKL